MFDLIAHIYRQRAFSRATFGPGARTQGVCDHIRKELAEIERAPADLDEWIDVILLSLDGAWRCAEANERTDHCIPEIICQRIGLVQGRNERRDWPDWRSADPNKAIEHVRKAHRDPNADWFA
jgi:hypothetical protein